VTRVATISSLWRFPVKSMAAEPLEAGTVGFRGIAGDRRYAFVREDDRTSFPWLTGRNVPELVRHVALPADAERPDRSPITVRTPGGRELRVDDDALRVELEERHGGPLTLLQSSRSLPDAAPLSLISTATIGAIAAATGVAPDPRRFRMNLVIDVESARPYAEEEWLGRELAIGDELRIRLDEHDERCMMITIDPDTAERTPAVLREVARQRRACLGVYASTVRPGIARVGDVVRLV
jgi:uncharacterized protein YcbX